MAKKYNKVTKESVFNLFTPEKTINRAYICAKLGCSIYLARQIIEELKDDNKIKLVNHGH